MRSHEIESHVQGNGGSVMFWSCITAEGPGYGTTVLDGSIISVDYIRILETSLLGTLELCDMDVSNVRFQQDNAPVHASALTRSWFSDKGFPIDTVFDWPPQSPDLNPIEHVWHQLKLKLNTYPRRPTTKDELEHRITTEWYKISKEECLKYIDSMPERIKAVIKSKGGPTRW